MQTVCAENKGVAAQRSCIHCLPKEHFFNGWRKENDDIWLLLTEEVFETGIQLLESNDAHQGHKIRKKEKKEALTTEMEYKICTTLFHSGSHSYLLKIDDCKSQKHDCKCLKNMPSCLHQ